MELRRSARCAITQDIATLEGTLDITTTWYIQGALWREVRTVYWFKGVQNSISIRASDVPDSLHLQLPGMVCKVASGAGMDVDYLRE